MATIGWRHKAALQRVIDKLPAAHRVNYFFQRRVTHGVPRPDFELDEFVDLAGRHIQLLSTHGDVPVSEATFFEFGAGWDLAMPLTMYCFGVNRQTVIDIRPLMRPDLVSDIARRLRARPPGELPRLPPEGGSGDHVLKACGITYMAPADARATGLDDGAIDYVTSTNTLEHIPVADLAAILRECARILSPSGAASFQVDYQDHYSYFDKSISAYNYFQFDDAAWKRFNPSIHYQNRLRHSDYLRLYREAGFDVVADTVTPASAEDLATVDALPLADRFREYDKVDLATRRAGTVLRKR